MSEEQTEKGKQEATTDNSKDGLQQKTVSELDRADQIAQMQKRENDRHETLITREENLEARRKVGGITLAGQKTEEKKEETPKEYRTRVEKEMAAGKREW